MPDFKAFRVEWAWPFGFSLLLAVLHQMHNHLWFHDPAIVWEGAYRLYLGQMPYRDFGLPVGVAGLLVPWLVMEVLGAGFDNLFLSAALVDAIAVFGFWGILSAFNAKNWLKVLAVGLFAVFHLAQLKFPWYNSAALAFELAGLALLAHSAVGTRRTWAVAGGLLVFLSFFTKQDYGAFAFAIGVGVCLLAGAVKWRVLGLYLSGFAAGAAVAFIAFARLGLLYWFNLGQPPHSSRIGHIASGLANLSFPHAISVLVGVGLLVWALSKRKALTRNELFAVAVSAGIILQNFITFHTSGLPAKSGYYFPAFLLVGVAVAAKAYFSRAAVVAAIAAGVFGITMLPKWYGVRDVIGWKATLKTHFFTKNGTVYIRGMDAGFPAFGSGYLPEPAWQKLLEIEKKWLPQAAEYRWPVLNITPLTPLALQWEFAPVEGQPLWVHSGITFFEKEEKKLVMQMQAREYGLVLFQKTPLLSQPVLQKTHTGWAIGEARFGYGAIPETLETEYQFVDSFFLHPYDEYPVQVYTARKWD